MNVQIDIHQERTVEEGPVFRVSTQTVYTYGIDPNIFVHEVETGAFSHVATVWDILNVSSDIVLARNNLEAYYRTGEAVVDYVDQPRASAGAEYTAQRVALLALTYDKMNTDFVGEDDFSYVEP